jgi:drug/metabolite transporter (DMT)-like permease
VFLWGFTGLFGRWITLKDVPLVWNRLLLCVPMLAAIAFMTGAFKDFKKHNLPKTFLIGTVVGLHWIFFYAAVKHSNASVGASCLSMVAVCSAFLEPIMHKKRIAWADVLLAVIAAVGMLFIFRAQPGFTLGIILGLIAALLSSLFTILNKRISHTYHPVALSFYELTGALLLLTFLLPFYAWIFPGTVIVPDAQNLKLLLLFAVGATIIPFVLSLYALREVSAFFATLSLNLEPVYTIILAALLLHEQAQLHTGFYIGAGLILLSVIMYVALQSHKRLRDSVR